MIGKISDRRENRTVTDREFNDSLIAVRDEIQDVNRASTSGCWYA